MKTGQNVKINKETYLFLGFSDYKRKIALLTDKHGNKIEVFTENLTIKL